MLIKETILCICFSWGLMKQFVWTSASSTVSVQGGRVFLRGRRYDLFGGYFTAYFRVGFAGLSLRFILSRCIPRYVCRVDKAI